MANIELPECWAGVVEPPRALMSTSRTKATRCGQMADEGPGQDGGVAKIELPEGWAGVAEPLRALMAEVNREGHVDRATPPDLAAVSARWARVSDAIRATVRARIAHAQAAQAQAPKR